MLIVSQKLQVWL